MPGRVLDATRTDNTYVLLESRYLKIDHDTMRAGKADIKLRNFQTAVMREVWASAVNLCVALTIGSFARLSLIARFEIYGAAVTADDCLHH